MGDEGGSGAFGRLASVLVLLAAGRSSRMGKPKGLVLAGDRAWLAWHLSRFCDGGGGRAIVVLGAGRERYSEALSWVTEAERGWVDVDGLSVTVALNPAPERGQLSSLICGFERVGAVSSAFVLPVDLAPVPRDLWRRLEGALRPRFDACVPTFHGRGGHPVLCSSRMVREIGALDVASADARLDTQIRAREGRVSRVPVDDLEGAAAVTTNLNTPEDWERWLTRRA